MLSSTLRRLAAAAALAVALATTVSATSASADPPAWAPAHGVVAAAGDSPGQATGGGTDNRPYGTGGGRKVG
jgi:hypothetical protein